MKAKIPEPVKPRPLYSLKSKEVFDRKTLEALLAQAKESLDKVCEEEFKSRKMLVANYEIIIEKYGQSQDYPVFIVGGFNLGIRAGFESALPDFQKRYAREFDKFLESFPKAPEMLGISIEIFGAPDSVTRSVNIQSPYSKED